MQMADVKRRGAVSEPSKPKAAPAVNASRPANLLTDDVEELLQRARAIGMRLQSGEASHLHMRIKNEILRRLNTVCNDLHGIKAIVKR